MDVEQRIVQMIDEAQGWEKACLLLIAREGEKSEDFPQSPIELLLQGAIHAYQIWPDSPKFRANKSYSDSKLTIKIYCLPGETFETMVDTPPAAYPYKEILIFPQVVIGKYRVDFLAAYSLKDGYHTEVNRYFLAIECDGHEFHEKTKEQAARDKARDRFLISQNVPVMRFSGSEIWASPQACVMEIVYYFEKMAQINSEKRSIPQ
ncbi:MAG TPA: DUF559 domain-containing protein [Candidatus Binatia bacterium]|nr:DUF559 domain-containing protein [Candidatus Binatia bacterium]